MDVILLFSRPSDPNPGSIRFDSATGRALPVAARARLVEFLWSASRRKFNNSRRALIFSLFVSGASIGRLRAVWTVKQFVWPPLRFFLCRGLCTISTDPRFYIGYSICQDI